MNLWMLSYIQVSSPTYLYMILFKNKTVLGLRFDVLRVTGITAVDVTLREERKKI